MTIVEGQIETLKNLKSSLAERGLSEFESIGQINKFQQNYSAEVRETPGRLKRELEIETAETKAACDTLSSTISDELDELSAKHNLERQVLEKKHGMLSSPEAVNVFLRIWRQILTNLNSYRKKRLAKDFKRKSKKLTREARKKFKETQENLNNLVSNKEAILAKRLQDRLDALNYTKQVLDSLYPVIAGAVGEHAVVKTLSELSNDYYLINDYTVHFNPPIINKKEDERISSIQVDHVVVCRAGVFLLETKNWSKSSVESLDLRSPVEQILRSSYAAFVLLNSESGSQALRLQKHHWGAKKVPIRNIIVMTNEKPSGEFKHVKVVALKDLIGYLKFFDSALTGDEVESIFGYLRRVSSGIV
jgi:hypothetical protein